MSLAVVRRADVTGRGWIQHWPHFFIQSLHMCRSMRTGTYCPMKIPTCWAGICCPLKMPDKQAWAFLESLVFLGDAGSQ